MSKQRPMLIFISDIHLTDQLKGPSVTRAETFDRFWVRISAARGDAPVQMVFVGDLFDIVRSPHWFESDVRPYHPPSPQQAQVVDDIVAAILLRETDFITRIRTQVQAGALEIRYLLGNHDRLLRHAPASRRRIWKALTGEDRNVDFSDELIFEDHGVVAFHGHTTDFICHEADGSAPIGDAIGSDLIVRFPRQLRSALGAELPELDDLDDVRPIFAVPGWVRHYAVRQKGILKDVGRVWRDVVDEFLENAFTREWIKRHKRGVFSGEGMKLQLLLQLSTGRIMKRTKDSRLAQLYRFFQQIFDGQFAQRAAKKLMERDYAGLRYVVNGHSHFSSMIPLGSVGGKPACYFNTGTWRTVHQMGRSLEGRPTFLPYESMSYLVFFPSNDPLERDYEWWTGAMVSRRHSEEGSGAA